MLQVLQDIPVISARGEYESQYPGERGRWKEKAFLELQRQLDSQIITNLISLGDSDFEMDAVHVMGQEFAQALVKTVKFRATPTAKELHKELELVAAKFEQIVNKASNLKICLERTVPAAKVKRQPSCPETPPKTTCGTESGHSRRIKNRPMRNGECRPVDECADQDRIPVA